MSPMTSPVSGSGEQFEGMLHYELIINDESQDFRYAIKRGLVRLEIDDPHMGGSMTILISPEDGRMAMLIHEIRAYTEIDINDVATRQESFINQMEQITETGNRMTIAGVETLEYLIHTDNNGTLRIWSPEESTQYGHFQFPDFGNRILAHMLNHDLPVALFPFAIEYESDQTHIEIHLQKIEEGNLAIDLFTVPANYRNISVTIPDY